MATVTKPVALNESLNTTDSTPKNIADVLKDKLGDIASAISGGGAGGHEIIDSEGNAMPQESAMQFADSFVTDDETNGRTIVENIKEVSPADYDSTTDEGIIVTDDGNDALIGAVSDDYVEVTASSDTYMTALNKLRKEADFDKITKESYIKLGNNVYIVTALLNNEIYFSSVLGYAGIGGSNIQTIFMPKSGVGNCSFQECVFTSSISRTNKDASSVTDGTKITLYYGNKKATVDLQTTANRCLLPDGETTVADVVDCDKTTAGTYALKCTVDAQGNKTYSWV